MNKSFKSFTFNNYTYYTKDNKYFVIYNDYNMIKRKQEITEELYNKVYNQVYNIDIIIKNNYKK